MCDGRAGAPPCDALSGVPPPAGLQVRGTQHIQLEGREYCGHTVPPRSHEETGLMRVGDNLFANLVPCLAIVVGDAEPQRMVRQRIQTRYQVFSLVMKERVTIGNQVLQVAQLWPVDGGEVGFRDDAEGERVPKPAAGRISGADAVFGAAGPARFDARAPERPTRASAPTFHVVLSAPVDPDG